MHIQLIGKYILCTDGTQNVRKIYTKLRKITAVKEKQSESFKLIDLS